MERGMNALSCILIKEELPFYLNRHSTILSRHQIIVVQDRGLMVYDLLKQTLGPKIQLPQILWLKRQSDRSALIQCIGNELLLVEMDGDCMRIVWQMHIEPSYRAFYFNKCQLLLLLSYHEADKKHIVQVLKYKDKIFSQLLTKQILQPPNLIFQLQQDDETLWSASQLGIQQQYCLFSIHMKNIKTPAFIRYFYFPKIRGELLFEFKLLTQGKVLAVISSPGTLQDPRYTSRFHLWHLEEQESIEVLEKVFWDLLFYGIVLHDKIQKFIVLGFHTADPATDKYFIVNQGMQIVGEQQEESGYRLLSEGEGVGVTNDEKRTWVRMCMARKGVISWLLEKKGISTSAIFFSV